MIHDDIFKPDASHNGILAASAPGLNAESAVRVEKQAVLNIQVFHAARHLASDCDGAMPVPHTALPDCEVFRWCLIF